MSAIRMTLSPETLTAPSVVETDVRVARETLRLESQALLKQADRLDASFSAAVGLVYERSATGRLIVTGVGKAGHVCRKITATLASTGTAAYFVHPAEASHGDMGMITENDTILAVSKSGESKELRDILTYAKRFQIPVIAVTMDTESTLARHADHIVALPECAEACPNQQAPTTSTIMMMGFGDALAVALMQRRGFSATDFKRYHPGGKLGGQLVSVQSLMQQGDTLPLIAKTKTMQDAIAAMSAHNFGCVIITDATGALAGFISDGDIRRHLSVDLMTQPVTAIMNATPLTIPSDALASAALALMNQKNITQLIVLDGQRPVGLLRLHDVLKAGVA